MSVKQVQIIKRNGVYIFWYEIGNEQNLFEELSRQANNPTSGIDWFDVGVLCKLAGYTVSQGIAEYLPHYPNTI